MTSTPPLPQKRLRASPQTPSSPCTPPRTHASPTTVFGTQLTDSPPVKPLRKRSRLMRRYLSSTPPPVVRTLFADFDAADAPAHPSAAAPPPLCLGPSVAACEIKKDLAALLKKEQQRVRAAFKTKWNWDVYEDCPVQGMWKWEPLPSRTASVSQ